MSTLPDRHQMNRSPLDNWTKREKLCLASAVSCSGDQNWITVSRTIKGICGNELRPADWYSQKNCALQYGYLLESVESTKRKKRESGAGSSPLPVEPPTELLLKRVTDERLQDIKEQIRKDQEEYSALWREISAIQSGKVNDEELREMWRTMETQKEIQRIDEMKMENRMREREQLKQEMVTAWRSGTPTAKRSNSNTDTSSVDMDVEEISTKSNVQPVQQQQQQQQSQPATSPLLSSLLKSPTSGNVSSNTSLARTTAPTITTLLTSGNIPNQPAITIRNNVPASETAFITRPISGPPVETNVPITGTGKSPSESAPTLSMLLEKNKSNIGIVNVSGSTNIGQQATQVAVEMKPSHDTYANNDEVPMDIEENVQPNTAAVLDVDSNETTEPDEAELLEVLKDIPNIDDIDIDMTDVMDDEEVDFLEGVTDDTSANDVKGVVDFEDKMEEIMHEDTATNDKNCINENNLTNDATTTVATETKVDIIPTEVIASSDDSNDNVPLATLENKERCQSTTESVREDAESVTEAKEQIVDNVQNFLTNEILENDVSEESKTAANISTLNVENTDSENITKPKLPTESDSSDVVLIPTDDDESVFEKPAPTQTITDFGTIKSVVSIVEENLQGDIIVELNQKVSSSISAASDDKIEATRASEISTESKIVAATDLPNTRVAISIADTDEDSSMTDASKDDACSNKSTITSGKNKSLAEEINKPEPEASDNNSVAATQATANGSSSTPLPARPPALRKIRDHDRSESPMIDDETTTTSDHSTKQSSRRRYSSTPVLDSIPNSPASSEHTIEDRRETRGASKKMFLTIYNTLNDNKNAAIFRRPFYEEHTTKYAELCLRPMDLPTIKKNIDSGIIRSIVELHRDVLLMCHNILFIYRPHTAQYKSALALHQDCQQIKEFTALQHDNRSLLLNTSGNKSRSGARKSQRHI